MRLSGRRVLVVGASSGVGRATGLAAAAEGARVAFAARRLDRLEVAAAEAGRDAIAIECDVADEVACQAMVARAVDHLGGLDAVVYAPGIAVFKGLADLETAEWRQVLDVNLLGATAVARAAISHLESTRGKAVFVTSISIDDQPPRASCAPYVVSKIALEALVRAWQGEHHKVGFTTVAMGDTITEFSAGQDPTVIGPIIQRWVQEGYLYGQVMEADAIADQIVGALASPATVRRIAITPPFGDVDVAEVSPG